jgi:hypothetical protein
MIPAVQVPRGAGIKTPIEVKLKPRYRYDPARRVFESDSGKVFKPAADLPKKTRIVHKVPALAVADPKTLSRHERDLGRYLQVILPEGKSPADYVETIRSWPGVEAAWVAPEVSLPHAF